MDHDVGRRGFLVNCGSGMLAAASASFADAQITDSFLEQELHPHSSDRAVNGAVVDVRAYGAIGDGVADDTEALLRAITSASSETGNGAGRLLLFPAGFRCTTSTELNIPANCSVHFGANASITALRPMRSVVRIGCDAISRSQYVSGYGIIDAANLAESAILVHSAIRLRMQYLTLMNATGASCEVGVYGSHAHCYEIELLQLRSLRAKGVMRPNGSCGFKLGWCTDSLLIGCSSVGSEMGFDVERSGNRLIGCFAWSYPTDNGWMHTCFRDSGSVNLYSGCCADTPGADGDALQRGIIPIGFDLRGEGTQLQGVRIYNNAIYGTDQRVAGIALQPKAHSASVVGAAFFGQDSQRRIRTALLVTRDGDPPPPLVAPVTINCSKLIETRA